MMEEYVEERRGERDQRWICMITMECGRYGGTWANVADELQWQRKSSILSKHPVSGVWMYGGSDNTRFSC